VLKNKKINSTEFEFKNPKKKSDLGLNFGFLDFFGVLGFPSKSN
jgi:hypothetical protein